jgi:hypothetical protein
MCIMTRIADVDQALIALDGFLRDHDYTAESRRRIADHVRTHGTLEGASPRWLDLEHVETAEGVFVEALPSVPECSTDWDVEGYWTPSDTFRIAPPDPDTFDDIDVPDAPDFAITRAAGYAESLAADGITLLPISGGSPDEPPYEPTEADRREYAAFSEQLDRARAWYDRNGADPDRPMGRGFIPA